jgi:peptide/nickel transport system ATP-binding protein
MTAAQTHLGEVAEGRQLLPVLKLSDFSVAYRTTGGDIRAVDGVNLDLAPGEVVGLAGESGSGKSTLAYGACRLLRAPAVITGGSVTYRGRRLQEAVDITALRTEQLRALRWREIAIVFQSAMNALNPVLNVRDQLVDVIETHLPLKGREARERASRLLDFVSIPSSRLRSYPHELSGGMRQRVMIAMALATDPEIVIMDEPTTALDVVVQREILAQIVDLKEELGFAVLFITHDLSLLLELADRVAVMYAGKLVEVASAQEIHHAPAHPYTKGLLSSFPSLRGRRRELAGIPGSPPDLRALPPGCAFLPRCAYGTDNCREVDMRLVEVASSPGSFHVTACPFVTAETPVPAGTGRSGDNDVGAAQHRREGWPARGLGGAGSRSGTIAAVDSTGPGAVASDDAEGGSPEGGIWP